MSKITTRVFRKEDAKAVSAIMWKGFEFFHRNEPKYKPFFTPEVIRNGSLSRTALSETISYVVEVDGCVAGYARGTINPVYKVGS